MAHYPVKQGLHILSSHNKMRTLQLPRKSHTTSTDDRDAGMGLLSLNLSLTNFTFTLTCMACPPLAPCAFRLSFSMYCYFFQLSGSQFFFLAKAALGSCCTNFLIITIMNFIRREKKSGGALGQFHLRNVKIIVCF